MDGGAPKRRLGEQLIERGLISPDQLRIALIEQQNRKAPLGEVLVALGFVQEETLREVLAETLGVETASLANLVPDPQALALLPKEVARRQRVFPVAYEPAARRLTVAIADSNDIVAMDAVRAHLAGRATVQWRLASNAEIAQAIETFYGRALTIEGILQELETGNTEAGALEAGAGYEHPIVRLVDALLTDAVLAGASDLHFEPEASFVRIRYRIDGVLHQVRALHKRHWSAVAVRLKIMAAMNIAEQRAAQDGHIARTLAGREISFRAAVHPTVHGENIVLRVLDRKRGIVPLDRLGLREAQLALLRRILQRPEGILLVTGPTGSGKTTTLYAALNKINTIDSKVLTAEDPVEYEIEGIQQVPVNEGIGLTFARVLRAFLRQDPDRIMVGETRDLETAQIAVQASLTGHLVFTTLHTNDAAGAVTRLIDMGVEPFLISSTLEGILAQRLIRTICKNCKISVEPTEQMLSLINLTPEKIGDKRFFTGAGCPDCNNTGYRGRKGIYELLDITDPIRELINQRAPSVVIRQRALELGMTTLREDGLRCIYDGDTTIEEVIKYT